MPQRSQASALRIVSSATADYPTEEELRQTAEEQLAHLINMGVSGNFVTRLRDQIPNLVKFALFVVWPDADPMVLPVLSADDMPLSDQLRIIGPKPCEACDDTLKNVIPWLTPRGTKTSERSYWMVGVHPHEMSKHRSGYRVLQDILALNLQPPTIVEAIAFRRHRDGNEPIFPLGTVFHDPNVREHTKIVSIRFCPKTLCSAIVPLAGAKTIEKGIVPACQFRFPEP